MDRKSFTGLLLIGAVLLIWSQFFTPKPTEVDDKPVNTEESSDSEREDRKRDEVIEKEVEVAKPKMLNKNNLLTKEDSVRYEEQLRSLSQKHGIFTPSAAENHEGKGNKIILENEKIIAHINPIGGSIEKVYLKEYQTWMKDSLILMDEKSNMQFWIPNESNGYYYTEDYYFEPQGGSISVTGESSDEVKLRLNTIDPTKYIEYTYTMDGNDYEIDFNITLNNLEQEIDLRRDDLVYKWNLVGLSHEKSSSFEDSKSSVFYKYVEEDRSYMSETSDEEMDVEANLEWVAMKQYFFSAVAIPETPFIRDRSTMSIKKLEDPTLTKEYDVELTMAMSDSRDPSGNIKYFFGPNQYPLLKSYDNGMDKIIDIGWGIFGWMNKVLVIPVFNFLNKYIGSFGIIILLLTVFIKMILFPLTYKNYLSSAKMKVLKPDIAELTSKFKDDAMKKQQATMALYRQSGVNPMAGCLPMLVQMPVLYAMFNFFPSSIELRQQPFLWADDLSTYDSILSIPEIPLYGAHISLFTLLMAASTILYTRMNSSQMPDSQPGMPNMKVMMYIFPFMMLFFFNKYPSGLSYYYLLANVISMIQMYVIKKYIIDENKIRAQIDLNKKTVKKKSKFQQRLEEASKLQQQKAAQKKRR